jgi:hypothetical protein
MKLSLPLFLFASAATPSVFCHGRKDDEPHVRRRSAANGTSTPAHENLDIFGTNNVGNMTTADGTHSRRTQDRIVGGTQAKFNEFPYYGKST